MKVYIYVPKTMADWEIGYAAAELNSRRFFKQDAPETAVKTVGLTRDPVKTMGGMTILPDMIVSEIDIAETSVLILPGADTWNDPENGAIIEAARALLSIGGTVCAICGATVALANAGLLNDRAHTSNGVGFLDMMSEAYCGQRMYVDRPVCADGNLVTAGGTAGLEFAKQIFEMIGVMSRETLEAWYDYFSTGAAEAFFRLMQSVQR